VESHEENRDMSENQIVHSSFTAIINAPIDKVDILAWCFSLPDREYQGWSPAHIAAGFTTAPDGKRMSINVEFAAELGYEVTAVKDATADYSDEEMHVALDINIPNYASAIVGTNDIVDLISSVQTWGISA
jgi:hypothetical protein